MESLQEFLHRKRLPVRDILTGPCRISVKVDGSAFQSYYDMDNDILTFGKRPDSCYVKSGKPLCEIDRLMNDSYNNAYMHLSKYEDILKQYKIINFEVFGNNDNHIIHYTRRFKNNIVLLSCFNFDGSQLSDDELNLLADQLEVSVRDIVFKRYGINDKIVDDLLENKDDEEQIWNIFFSDVIWWDLFCETYNIDKDDIDSLEGFVLNYYTQKRMLKVLNPTFNKKLTEKLSDGKEQKLENYEDVYDYVMSCCEHITPKNTDAETLLCMYYACLKNGVKTIEKSLENNSILCSQQINILLLRDSYPQYTEDIKYPNLLKFIFMGFRNMRKIKTLWCTLDYQVKLNEFISKHIKNN